MDEIEKLRRDIDKLDSELICILQKRFALVREISQHKKSRGVPTIDPVRNLQVYTRYQDLSQKHDIAQDFIKRLYDLIYNESVRIQT